MVSSGERFGNGVIVLNQINQTGVRWSSVVVGLDSQLWCILIRRIVIWYSNTYLNVLHLTQLYDGRECHYYHKLPARHRTSHGCRVVSYAQPRRAGRRQSPGMQQSSV
jgi:hypothetical protein